MVPGSPARILAPDSRILSGMSYGPPTGRPVLFVAGAATGKTMSFGGNLLDEQNVRLLTMDRPGMGGSTFDSGRTLSSTADDYRTFVEAVLDRAGASIPVVANSQGSVFGLAAAIAGWASRLVLVSPADELAHPEVHAMLPPEATQLSDLARADPERAADFLSGFTADAMEAMVLDSSSESDRAFYTTTDFLAVYRRALAEGFVGGGRGYVRDTLMAMRPWDLPLDEIQCPVDVLFGAHDRGHSPDHGATLARRVPGARRELFSDAGGALLWTHTEELLKTLLQ